MPIFPESITEVIREAKREEPTREVAFLLGSGFSRPDNMPLVGEINERLVNLSTDEFYLQSMQAGFYMDDHRSPNAWQSENERKFAVAFIRFYVEAVLKGDAAAFNYERFFDYFNEFYYEKLHAEEITSFCGKFNEEHRLGSRFEGARQLISDFLNIFNQLVASLLVRARHYGDTSWTGAYTHYEHFCRAMGQILKERIVQVHTLNHDLLFDWMAGNISGFWQHFSDGFSEMQSAYFGELSHDFPLGEETLHKTYKVRVPFYQDKYTGRLRLYKLHGSINYYALHQGRSSEQLMVKRDYAVGEIYREYFDEQQQKYVYDNPFTRQFPSYLTGTTQKIKRYGDPFYEHLFKHFQSNLTAAEQLIVIGYGFQDQGINDLLEAHYLANDKRILVVDVRKPESPLLEKYAAQFEFALGSVTDIPYQCYLDFIGR